MKRNIGNLSTLFYLVIVFLSLSSCEKEDLFSIENNKPFGITSKHTGTRYTIHVLYPESYMPSNSYHVVYMLDGEDYFKEAVDVVKEFQREDIILIGIGYANKNRRGTDYSYPKDPDFPHPSGGGKKFIDFMNKELIPYIEGELKIIPVDRTLYGHSLGGYLALYTLFQQEQPNLFKNVIAASPNLMWYNSYLFYLEQQYYDIYKELDKNLYITVGDLEGASINLFFNAFTQRINKRSYNGLFLDYERLKNTSHRNSPILSLKKGLSIIL